MTKRMHFYLNYYKELLEKDLSPEKAQQEKENLLVQIQFFQHERLIHLIVTALFALLTVITLLSNLFLMQPLLCGAGSISADPAGSLYQALLPAGKRNPDALQILRPAGPVITWHFRKPHRLLT